MGNLVSIENGYQPVHRARSVALAECNVFPKDAPGILDGRQYDVLIRGAPTERGINLIAPRLFLFFPWAGLQRPEHLPDDSQYQDHRMA